MKTYTAKTKEIERQWHLIDASGKTLGRLATDVVRLLMGKGKPIFTRNLDTGDFVVVTNVSKIVVTGKKDSDKMYYSHSGYPGGFKAARYREVIAENPTRAFEKAVKGMLPHTRLGAMMFKKLKAYAGADHPHAGQIGQPAQSLASIEAKVEVKRKQKAAAAAIAEKPVTEAKVAAPKVKAEDGAVAKPARKPRAAKPAAKAEAAPETKKESAD